MSNPGMVKDLLLKNNKQLGKHIDAKNAKTFIT
jgi:hypothetical protein